MKPINPMHYAIKAVFFSLIFFSASQVNAQKSSPVFGDAATLIDLLKKDYNAIAPENRDDEIIRDRAKTIGIFKSYLGSKKAPGKGKDTKEASGKDNDSKKASGKGKNTKKAPEKVNDTYKTKLKDYLEAKEAFETYKNSNISISGTLATKIHKESIDALLGSLRDAKTGYIAASYTKDSLEFNFLKCEYGEPVADGTINPYLKHVINAFGNKYKSLHNYTIDSLAQNNYQSSIQKSLPFLGGDLAFETLIDGLSRFLAKRIKNELTFYVVDKIKNELESENPKLYIEELLVLLPKTTNYLKGFEADQALNFVDELKQYIEGDLNSLLDNAIGLRETKRFKALIKNNPDIDFAFEALELIPQISKIKNPIDYFDLVESSRNLSRWADEEEKNKTKNNIAQSIRLASMIAHSLTVLDNGELKFASTDMISNYASEPNFYLLYFGFLKQQNDQFYDVKFTISEGEDAKTNELNTLFGDLMNKKVTPENIVEVQKFSRNLQRSLTKITEPAERIYNDVKSIKKAKNSEEGVAIKTIHSFIDNLIMLSEQVMESSDELLTEIEELKETSTAVTPTNAKKTWENDTKLDLQGKTAQYFKVARKANDIMLDLHEKRFSSAILETIDVFATITQKDIAKPIELVFVEQNDVALDNEINKLITKPSSANSFSALFDKKNQEILMPFISYGLKDKKDKVKKERQKEVYLQLSNLVKTHKLTNAEGSKKVKTEFLEWLNAEVYSWSQTNLYQKSYLIKMVHFVNDIALAENATDVESAVDAFALPSGSYRLKKKKGDFVAINSYPGLLFAAEQSTWANSKFAVGLTAPIGLSTKINKTFGLFVPLIDIAAPVRFRFDEKSDTEALPEFKFENILAPGLYFTILPWEGSPFSLNVGGQYGPELQFENEAGELQSQQGYFRVGAGLTFDIPLVTLFSKPKD